MRKLFMFWPKPFFLLRHWPRLLGLGLLLLLVAPPAPAAPIVVNLKTTFGAKGDGKADDQPAFDRAEAYLQAHPNGVKLVVPAGTYRVGRQTGLQGDDVLHLTKCRNLTIEGAGPARTHIRYRDGLKFGGFEGPTGPALTYNVPIGSDKVASPGYFMWLEECDNVQVRGLDVDGNNRHFQVGGPVSDGGWQVSNDGLMLLDCTAVTLEQLKINYFGRDGLQIKHRLHPTTFSTPLQHFRLRDCAFEYNGRQGLSWTGGRGLEAVRCKFSHTGRGKVASAPGAGVDIEVEDGSKISDGQFVDCEFVDNNGVGMVSDQPEAAADVRDIHFERCLFWGTTAYTTWVRKFRFRFSHCTFHGSIVHGADATTDADATQYDHCSFDLRPYQGKPAYGKLLVESYLKGYRMLFDQCRFTISDYAHAFYYIFLGDHPPQDYVRFRNCDFLTAYRTEPTQGSLSFLVGGTWEGTNRFLDSTRIRRTGPPPARGHVVTTSFSPAVVQGTLLLAAGPDVMHKTENGKTLTIGPDARDTAAVVVAAHNELFVYYSTVNIGANSRLVVRRGGLLRITTGTTLNVLGTIEVEDGGYICLDPGTIINRGPNSRIILAPQALVGTDNQRYPEGGKPGCRPLP